MFFESFLWCIPFVLCLLSISIIPLIAKRFWHKNSFYVLSSFAMITLLAICYIFSFEDCFYTFFNVIFNEYIPFITLILALYVVSSGIYIDFPNAKGPLFNSLFLFIASHFAGWIGTTGATVLFIRPLLRVNSERKYKTHLLIFFLLIVSNIGGAASPLGDPPLFIGFMKGVDFFWFVKHLYKYIFFITCILCIMLFFIDSYYLKKEINKKNHQETAKQSINQSHEALKNNNENKNINVCSLSKDSSKPCCNFQIKGLVNIFLIMAILATVVFCSFEGHYQLMQVDIELSALIRSVLLIAITCIAMLIADKEILQINNFNFAPIKEVAEVFLAIFITVSPILNMLANNPNGIFNPIFDFLSSNGEFIASRCFWISGLLSSILDNAPTFLIFFHMIEPDATIMMSQKANLLTAISLSTVFMGSLTYIGNAPNFMVKNIAESNKINMPTFGQYMLIAFAILTPLFILLSLFL